MPILVDATCFHPDLHACDRCAAIFLNDDVQAVGKRPNASTGCWKLQIDSRGFWLKRGVERRQGAGPP
jgi:hypothetical protein